MDLDSYSLLRHTNIADSRENLRIRTHILKDKLKKKRFQLIEI